jgi:L-amino acid N-acyltransferase YncA
MTIRKATEKDLDEIWEIFYMVIQTGDTYVIPPDTSRSALKKHWFADSMQTFIVENEQKIVGTYIIKPNQIGAGSHIANASYMVHPDHRGQGIGQQLCEHSITYAKREEFRGMQFNIVVSTNEAAIKLWQKNGFEIIGRTPGGFLHLTKGFVDSLIMFKSLID